MKSLDRKLLRNLWGMKGQALAIALVIASGVATYIMSLTTLDSLNQTREIYYREHRFAEIFVSLKRAPESLAWRIAEIPGVEKVETRVTALVSVDIDGFPDPVTGRLISLPDGSAADSSMMNRLYLRKGRLVEAGRDNEVVVSEAFSKAHNLSIGDRVGMTINGRRRGLNIVGIALSPEYVLQIRPGALVPDFKRYGIFWMGRTPLARAYNMEGAFNDIVMTMSGGGSDGNIIDRLDDLLTQYGGLGAYSRDDQTSHRFLSMEFQMLGQMATLFPVIFLGVAAFLLNVVINRLITLQREEIAILKAFGYTNIDVASHYLKLVLLIVVVGSLCGMAAGAWLGRGLSGMYMEFYHFPFLHYEIRPLIAVTAVLVTLAAAGVGTTLAIRRAALLPPAVAMRPEPSLTYRETVIERLGLKRLFGQPTRMIMRHLERRPVKSALSVIGIAFACAILMMGSFFGDAVDYMIYVHYGLAEREDLTITFNEPTSKQALYELQALRGVEFGEPFRSVPVRFRFQHREYRTAIQGFEPGTDLHRLLDSDLVPMEPPPSGIVLTDYLGTLLGAKPGDTLTVEVLEGSRPTLQIPLMGLVKEFTGVLGYMKLDNLNRVMGEGNAISGVNLAIDSRYRDELYGRLKKMPRVAGVVSHMDTVKNVRYTMDKQVLTFTFFNVLLAATIAFGVVYNSARIALSERSRELASLRVLGFTRGEISYILLGELTLLTMAAIPLGFLIGRVLCAVMIEGVQTDIFRIPLVVDRSTYAFASAVVIVSACISGLIVRRKLDRLDLIGVLKTKE
ncbi:MAG: ABC transporter permease [Thermodesulfobacteriota bacterium]